MGVHGAGVYTCECAWGGVHTCERAWGGGPHLRVCMCGDRYKGKGGCTYACRSIFHGLSQRHLQGTHGVSDYLGGGVGLTSCRPFDLVYVIAVIIVLLYESVPHPLKWRGMGQKRYRG